LRLVTICKGDRPARYSLKIRTTILAARLAAILPVSEEAIALYYPLALLSPPATPDRGRRPSAKTSQGEEAEGQEAEGSQASQPRSSPRQ
jgi:hypothetical protein